MNGALIVLDPRSPLSPYEQIAVQIRRDIATQTLLPGEALPSVRQLARDLRVAPNTVARAYGDLVRAGWLSTSLRRGVRVAAYPPVEEASSAPELSEAVGRLLALAAQLGVSSTQLHAEIERQLAAREPWRHPETSDPSR